MFYEIGDVLFENSRRNENKEAQGIRVENLNGSFPTLRSYNLYLIYGTPKEIDYGGDEQLNATSQALIGIFVSILEEKEPYFIS